MPGISLNHPDWIVKGNIGGSLQMFLESVNVTFGFVLYPNVPIPFLTRALSFDKSKQPDVPASNSYISSNCSSYVIVLRNHNYYYYSLHLVWQALCNLIDMCQKTSENHRRGFWWAGPANTTTFVYFFNQITSVCSAKFEAQKNQHWLRLRASLLLVRRGQEKYRSVYVLFILLLVINDTPIREQWRLLLFECLRAVWKKKQNMSDVRLRSQIINHNNLCREDTFFFHFIGPYKCLKYACSYIVLISRSLIHRWSPFPFSFPPLPDGKMVRW